MKGIMFIAILLGFHVQVLLGGKERHRQRISYDCPKNCKCERIDKIKTNVYCDNTDRDSLSLPGGMPENTTFVSCHNYSVALTNFTFQRWPLSVRILDLKRNEISYIENFAFKRLINLMKLSLAENKIKAILHISFPESLKKLDLRKNPLQNFQFSLCNTHLIMKVLISCDADTEIDACSKDCAVHLYDLLTNKLSPGVINYPPNFSEKCSFLTRNFKLDCSKRNLTTVPEKLLNSSKEVDLSENSIMIIDDKSFCFWPIESLEVLNISHNRISRISEKALVHLVNLQILDLSNNNLTEISKVNFPPLLRKLYIENNPMNYSSLMYHHGSLNLVFTDCGGSMLLDVMKYLKPDGNSFLSCKPGTVNNIHIQVNCECSGVYSETTDTPNTRLETTKLESELNTSQRVKENNLNGNNSTCGQIKAPENTTEINVKPAGLRLLTIIPICIAFFVVGIITGTAYKHCLNRNNIHSLNERNVHSPDEISEICSSGQRLVETENQNGR